MISNFKKVALAGYFGGLGILGFQRGTHSYQYYLDKFNKNRSPKDKQNYFHLTYFVEGVLGSVIYICPLTALFMIPKEIYRLEVNLRNLEEEKQSDWYNRLT